MIGIFVDNVPAAEKGNVEVDHEFIIAIARQNVGNVDSLRDKHVFRFENDMAIQHDCSESVKTVKC